jgi:hypothetical protein
MGRSALTGTAERDEKITENETNAEIPSKVKMIFSFNMSSTACHQLSLARSRESYLVLEIGIRNPVSLPRHIIISGIRTEIISLCCPVSCRSGIDNRRDSIAL